MPFLSTLLPWLATVLLATLFWQQGGQGVSLPDVPAGRYQCLSYAPFREGQTPFDPNLFISRQQIEEDLNQLAPLTHCVRTYSATQGQGSVVELAEKKGLQVLLGTWIGPDKQINAQQMAATLAVAKPGVVRALVVGNEVLLRRELNAPQLIEVLQSMRKQSSLPITYADVWEFWLQNPQVAEHVDFLTIHLLPYWEDHPVGVPSALEHVRNILIKMQQAFPGKTILVGEIGWPSAGRSRQEAIPGRVEQARFIREFIALTSQQEIAYNLIEAFDQPWKRFQEGTVGSHWGLFNHQRQVKFPLTGPVTPLPSWPIPLALGAAFSLVLLLFFAQPHHSFLRRFALALLGMVSSGLAFWRWQQLNDASQNFLDWSLGWTGLLLLLLVTLSIAALLGQHGNSWLRATPCSLQQLRAILLGRGWALGISKENIFSGILQAATLFSAALTALCLVTDGRYRDFPSALYALPVLLLWLRWLTQGERPQGAQEHILGVLLLLCAAFGVVIELPVNREAMLWQALIVLMSLPLLSYAAIFRLKQEHPTAPAAPK
ncbi:glycoside hydrolase family 17 [Candidatus Magnetaquicoccus inordinatus]|uniref:glycoside hydrolase family 17 protein n=1 Tax=Candidatus Magnetaquicoccus inordinatus TaxID=2496818 RepID=UPI00102AB17E|nr:glycoside hydrolase family 17 [Candidatus Magnetaquicoccus inordinatus]